MKTLTKASAWLFTAVPALVFLSLAPISSSAQPLPLSVGESVQVVWRDRTLSYDTFTLRSASLDIVHLDEQHVVARRGRQAFVIDRQSIRAVRRRIGTRPASAPAMVVGSGVGFAAAFVLGALGSDGIEDGGRVNDGLSAGVLVGAPVGAFVAWMSSRSRGIYEDVPFGGVITSATLSPEGRVGVTLELPR